MQFAMAEEGETLSELVQRIYCPASDSERNRITQLVSDANPNLKMGKSISKGTIVIIPQIAGIKPSNHVRTESQIAASFISKAREQIAGLGDVLDQLVDQEENQVQESLKLARSSEVKKLARSEPFVRQSLAHLKVAGKERLKQTKTLRSGNKKALEELESDFDGLLKMLDPDHTPPKTVRSKKRRKSQ